MAELDPWSVVAEGFGKEETTKGFEWADPDETRMESTSGKIRDCEAYVAAMFYIHTI